MNCLNFLVPFVQTQLEIDKAILQDPTVYEYDAVYDNIQAEKIKSDVKEKNKQDRKVRILFCLVLVYVTISEAFITIRGRTI